MILFAFFLIMEDNIMSKYRRPVQAILVLLMLLSLLGPAAVPVAATSPRIHPVLNQIAIEEPDQLVSVIVQQAGHDDLAENMARRLGGEVTRDLHIINAFAANMTASSARQLASSNTVRWVSLDAPVASTNGGGKGGGGNTCTDCPPNHYLETLNVQPVWDMGLRGDGVAVAVIDSGIFMNRDFSIDPGKPHTRIVKQLSFNPDSFRTDDVYGHGTHVAGIIGGNGTHSDGFYQGVAPRVDLINLKISDEAGMAYESDTVSAMQWVLDNKDEYNIRVVNLSIQSTVAQSYHTSPLDAAAEILWFNGVVVIAAAGNASAAGGLNPIDAAPANDPFIITVGASNEQGTADRNDDNVASFSAYGTTMDGFRKPDIFAPGKDIISVSSDSSPWTQDYPERTYQDGDYFRLSGTSMAAPMVAGAAALLLQDEPDLTPDQVKYRLMNASGQIPGWTEDDDGDTEPYDYAYLDVYAVVTATTTENTNTGTEASQLLWTGDDPVTWNSVNWNSVNWNAVNWNAVNWNAVNWNAVNWNAVSWEN